MPFRINGLLLRWRGNLNSDSRAAAWLLSASYACVDIEAIGVAGVSSCCLREVNKGIFDPFTMLLAGPLLAGPLLAHESGTKQ